jgi:hypothetical protein
MIMNKITFPLKLNMHGPALGDLQDALQLCLDHSAILANEAGARQQLSVALKPERGAQKYGDATAPRSKREPSSRYANCRSRPSSLPSDLTSIQ